MQTIRRWLSCQFQRHITTNVATLRKTAVHLHARLGYGDVGIWGEHQATRHLRRSGILVLETNWRHQTFEADIIGLEGRTLVIVEVKTRHARLRQHYPGRGAITERKQSHLRKLLRAYVRNHGPFLRRLGVRHHRIDMIEVYYDNRMSNQFSQNAVLWQKSSITA